MIKKVLVLILSSIFVLNLNAQSNRDVSFDFNNREAFIRGAFEGAPIYPGGIITNIGLETIVSVDLMVTVNGDISVYPISGLSLEQNERALIKVPNPIYMEAENLDISLEISNANGMGDDENPSNDIGMPYTIEHVIPYPGKGILAEEFTGTWCTNCPTGTVMTEVMHQRYPNAFVGIAVHNTDPMENEDYNQGMLDFGVQFLPSMIFNRDEVFLPGQLEQAFLTSITEAPKAMLSIGADYEENSRSLTVSLNANFQEDIPEGYKFNAIIVEDHVTGSGVQYQQVNENAGGVDMDIFSILPDPVPSDMMEYNHVARELLGGFDGTVDGLESSFLAGENAEVIFDGYTIPIDYNVEDLYIAGVIINELGEVDNANIVSLEEAISNGLSTNIDNVFPEDFSMELYPNPFKNRINIKTSASNALLQVFDVLGNQIRMQKINAFDKLIELDGSNLKPGTYIFKLSNASKTIVSKVLKVF